MVYPEAWQVLAESNLRLAEAGKPKRKDALDYLHATETALQKLFSINPNLALGHVTAARLHLLRAAQSRGELRQQEAQQALTALTQALHRDGLLARRIADLKKRAGELQATE